MSEHPPLSLDDAIAQVTGEAASIPVAELAATLDIEERQRRWTARTLAAFSKLLGLANTEQLLRLVPIIREQTAFITGLTVGGSEYFNRLGVVSVADLPACRAGIEAREAGRRRLAEALAECVAALEDELEQRQACGDPSSDYVQAIARPLTKARAALAAARAAKAAHDPAD